MSAPQITRSADHRYTYAGKTYPGVTSILDAMGVAFSVASAWGAKQTADAAIRLLPELPKILETVGVEGAKKMLADRRNWTRDAAAQKGTDIHAFADRIVNGERDLVVPEDIRQQVHHYAEWWAASGWTLRTSEAMVVNPDHGYGGTLDLLCRDRDLRTVLADVKTGRNIYDSAVLQLTAYGSATLIQTPATEDKPAAIFPMPAVDRYAILHVTADGVREIEVPVGTLEQLAWAACIDLSTWKETTKGKRL